MLKCCEKAAKGKLYLTHMATRYHYLLQLSLRLNPLKLNKCSNYIVSYSVFITDCTVMILVCVLI